LENCRHCKDEPDDPTQEECTIHIILIGKQCMEAFFLNFLYDLSAETGM